MGGLLFFDYRRMPIVLVTFALGTGSCVEVERERGWVYTTEGEQTHDRRTQHKTSLVFLVFIRFCSCPTCAVHSCHDLGSCGLASGRFLRLKTFSWIAPQNTAV